MLGKIIGQEKGATEDEIDMSLSKLWEIVEDSGPWHAAVYEVTNSQT